MKGKMLVGLAASVLAVVCWDVHYKRAAEMAVDDAYLRVSDFILSDNDETLEECVRDLNRCGGRLIFFNATPLYNAATSIIFFKEEHKSIKADYMRYRDEKDSALRELLLSPVEARYSEALSDFRRELEYIRRTL